MKALMPYKKVMIIEDNQVDQYIAGYFIQKTEYADKLMIMDSARAALTWLQNASGNEIPEIILLDICLPDMDGFGFLEEFQKLPSGIRQNCIIIMLSSSVFDDDRTRSLGYNCVERFICKPLTEQKLIGLRDSSLRTLYN